MTYWFFSSTAIFGADVFQFVNRIRKECSAASQVRQLFDHRAAGATAAQLRVEFADDADGVDLNVLFFDEFFDVGERVTASVVFTIRDQKQRFLGIGALLQFFQSEINGVVHRGHALRGRENEMVLEFRNIRGEIFGNFGPVCEFDKEVFVVRGSRLEKRNGGVTGDGDLSFMLPLMSKMMPTLTGTSSEEKYVDLLFNLVFPDLEMILFQACDVSIPRIGYRGIDQHQIDIDFERLIFVGFAERFLSLMKHTSVSTRMSRNDPMQLQLRFIALISCGSQRRPIRIGAIICSVRQILNATCSTQLCNLRLQLGSAIRTLSFIRTGIEIGPELSTRISNRPA